MKKLLTLVGFLAFQLPYLAAQWKVVDIGFPDQPLYSVDYYSPNVIWIGSYSLVVKTDDGGATWSGIGPLDEFGVPLWPANLDDIALTSPDEAIGVGFLYTGNSEHILKTKNGGANWARVTSNFTLPWPRYLASLDVWGNRAVAVGSNGRIARSNNAGDTWTFVQSGTTTRLEQVKFASPDTVFALGPSSGLLHSVNGGTTWSAANVTLEPGGGALGCSGNVVYVGGSTLKKSTDRGTTFTEISTGMPYISHLSVISKDLLVAACTDGLYLSKNSGLIWEKLVLPAYGGIRMMDFLDENHGIAVGGRGFVLQTNNLLATPTIPVGNFVVQGGAKDMYCDGDSIILKNTSAPGYTYRWLLNGQVFSQTYDTALKVTGTSTYDTLSLVVSNANGADTSSISFYTGSHFQINPFTLTTDRDTVCDGAKAVLTLPVPQQSIGYQLRQGSVALGSYQYDNGSGQPLRFQTPVISGTTTFNLVGRYEGTCFVDSFRFDYTIHTATALAGTPFSASKDTACYYDRATLSLPNSLPGYRYTWYSQTTGTSGSNFLAGNGSTLVIPLPPFDSSQSLAIRAVSDKYGCNSVFNPGKTLVIENPDPYFMVNTSNPELGEQVYTINNSVNPLGSYQWDFGAGAVPRFSSLAQPSNIVFQTAGPKNVKLVNISPYGCRDSTLRVLQVSLPSGAVDCGFSRISSDVYSGDLFAIRRDANNNLLAWYNGESARNVTAFGANGASVTHFHPDPGLDEDRYYLAKFNAKGTPLWIVDILGTSAGKRIETDAEGNIFCGGGHVKRICTPDGRCFSSRGTGEALMKFDRNGILQWVNQQSYAYSTIRSDGAGGLYVLGTGLSRYDAAGKLLWARQLPVNDFDLDSKGVPWVLSNFPPTLQKINPANGEILAQSQPVTSAYIYNMALDERDNAYLVGVFNDPLVFGNDTLPIPNPGGRPTGGVMLCKVKTDGRTEWVRQFHLGTGPQLKGLLTRGNHILLLATGGDTVHISSGLPPLPIQLRGHFLYHADSLGGSETLTLLHNFRNDTIFVGSWVSELLDFNEKTDRLTLGFEFEDTFTFAGQTVSPTHIPGAGHHNYFIADGKRACFMPDPPNNPTPYSYYLPNVQRTCAGESISFQDLSSKQPTSWKWEFPGGVPATSTDQHPIVTFNQPGTYTIRLTASNAAGEGTVFTRKIIITPVPTIAVTGDSVTCEGTGFAEFFANVSDPKATLQWQDSTSTHGWKDIPNATWFSVNVWQPALNLHGSRYRCMVTNYCRTYTSRSVALTVNALPVVAFNNLPDVCRNAANFVLKNGTPIGGQYAGQAVLSGGVFSPSSAFLENKITYTYTDVNGCTNKAEEVIRVDGDCWKQPCINHGLYFDNYDDQVNVSPVAGLPANSNFTFEAWVNNNYWSNQQCDESFNRLFSLFGGNTSFEFGECAGNLALSWRDAQGLHGPFFIQTPTLQDYRWHHVAVVRSGATVRVYLDGVQKFVSSGVGTLDLSTFRLGFWASSMVPGPGWRGQLDDVRIWNVARTVAQIIQDGRYCLPTGTEPNLVLYWKLDEGAAYGNNAAVTRVADASPNGNHGTLKNFALEGNHGSNFTCSDAPLLYGDFNFPASIHCGEVILFNDKFEGKYPDQLTYLWDFGDGTTSTERQPTHRFDACSDHTVCVTVSSAAGCGIKKCQETGELPISVSCPATRQEVALEADCTIRLHDLPLTYGSTPCGLKSVKYTTDGAANFTGTGDISGQFFPEGTSVVRYTATDICGKSATCSFEITVTSDVDLGLTGDFPLDGNADDDSPVALPGTVYNATLTEGYDGRPNSAYHFNGNSASIVCGGNNRGISNQVSICTWVRTTSVKGQWVAGKYSFEQDRGYHLGIGNRLNEFPGQVVFAGRDGTGEYHLSGHSSTLVNDGKWHCLAGTAAGDIWKVYVDGHLESSAFGTTLDLTTPSQVSFSIGVHTFNDPLWMDGDIDNLRVYNRALTACEVDSICTTRVTPTQEVFVENYRVLLFPNPNTGTFTVELPYAAAQNTRFRIADVAGRTLLVQDAQSGTARQTIEAGALPAGMYFLEVLEEGRVRGVTRFVKSDQ